MKTQYTTTGILREAFLSFIRRTRFFLLLSLLFFITFGGWLLTVEKGREVMLLNAFSDAAYDPAVLALTQLGLGSIAVAVALLLLLRNVYNSFLLLTSLAWVGFFTFITKRILFFQHPRPLHYFLYDDFPRFMHDVPLIYYNSFPSGHTMTIFAVAAMFSYLFARPLWSILWFVLALMVGLSRIYLLQHFGIDVIAGAVLGIISACLSVVVLRRLIKPLQEERFKQPLVRLVKLLKPASLQRKP